MTITTGESLVTEIRQLDAKGSGQAVVWRENELGNPKKLKLTIPQTLPGEKVRVTVDQPERRRRKAIPEEILEAHPERVVPPCIHFERCGGCVWQHWQYSGQLQQKTNHVKQVLEAQGFNPDLVQDTIGMKNPWHYRNKMEFTFAPDGSLGLHEQGNFRKIISLETCLIAGEEMVEAAMEVAKWSKEYQLTGYNKDTHEGLLRHLMVRQSFATGEMMLALFATESPNEHLDKAAKNLVERIEKKFPQVKSLLWLENTDWADRTQSEQTHVLTGRDFIYDEMAGYRYRLWFDTFFQTNPTQAQKLVELAIEMGKPKESEKMIDLFCGVGTFSLPFASRVNKLAGIEIVETSIESAKRNAQDNGISNTYFLAKDARKGIDQVLESFGHPELLMLDPPRSGAGGKVMRRIGRSKPERIVYVSCNPDTFATDIKELEPFGYTLKQVQPVDLFPHTVHVECVALLVRNEE
ncbi:23S rRNA (uracil(1939)-C(5))-methyltransferase RlmD [Heyndrickxia oleronia]|uniref:23S rRNA (uracil(1939)-C(5))-methyltransferase RlmD n=1 Tax=Heyndrickxia oleronia TaxID=38875 RepID=UPI0015D15DA8|nr:23S rRNA (uracil(1939)-C(5))-methyltransferase RlmD [Heyndrickxia oleronia]NYV64809.1 23S rRNA (uracil(1939)-C(5))-methyltransferase RlmD [Bacillus sp. Gen3]MCI1593029.1 23S rRNA (uracil(1939)-C(5))-methyltransferase RlmD [Heyndrickxia oleronia]MCI1615756.1 23S rRNA (uracil(1939)-C(5))-methyltransferase RlmD [Heyndrickxia oleronia]MCI1764087.1 23S rRNA (uracil(1939)-C(5))-methyltransferase RlmD [Heyndrickxia oleronia]MCM3456888.1 23S rRNA (uracil(1939)-C(5))-methyltransferase RlmD [Heyndric